LGFLGSLSSKLNSTWWEASPILGESNQPLCFTQNKPPDPPDPNFKALLKKGIPRFHLEKLEFNLGDSKIPGFQDSRIGGANDPTPNPKLLRIFC